MYKYTKERWDAFTGLVLPDHFRIALPGRLTGGTLSRGTGTKRFIQRITKDEEYKMVKIFVVTAILGLIYILVATIMEKE